MKIGILGLGSIGQRHAGILRGMGHDVVAYDPAHPGDPTFHRERLIGESDAMVIATPTPQHYQDLLDCMAAGKPTFVEKPIAATQTQWEQLHNYESVKQVFVGYNLRFHPCVQWVRHCLAEDMIGDVLHAAFVCAQRNAKYQDDLVLNWSHEIDLACHLFGPAGIDHSYDGSADRIDLMLWHDDGTRSHVYLNYITIPQARAFHVIGTRGHIRVDLANAMAETASGSNETDKRFFAEGAFDRTYVEEMKAFVAHVEGKPTIGATGEDGLAVLKLCIDARREA